MKVKVPVTEIKYSDADADVVADDYDNEGDISNSSIYMYLSHVQAGVKKMF